MPVKHCYLSFDVLLSAHILNGPWPLHDKKKMLLPSVSQHGKRIYFLPSGISRNHNLLKCIKKTATDHLEDIRMHHDEWTIIDALTKLIGVEINMAISQPNAVKPTWPSTCQLTI